MPVICCLHGWYTCCSVVFREIFPLHTPPTISAYFSCRWDFLIFRILPYLLVDLLVYFVLIRRYEGKSELKERDIRMILLALVILLTVVFLSVLVDSEMFRDESPLLRNVLRKIYAIFCCALSMFIAFSLSRQNRILHENSMLGLMVSGILFSREVFAFLPVSGGIAMARQLHIISIFPCYDARIRRTGCFLCPFVPRLMLYYKREAGSKLPGRNFGREKCIRYW